MRTSPTLLVAGFAAFSLTGCNWGSFDSLLDRAPVVVASAPGKSTTSVFVLPLPSPAEAGTSSAARMLVSRSDTDYLAVADFDLNGKVTLTEIAERSMLRGAPVLSAAARADGMILLGVPGFGGGNTPAGSAVSLALTPIPGGGYGSVMQPSVSASGAMSRVGLGVAAGNVTGAATGDFVVVGDGSVQVVGADGKTEVASASLCQSLQFGGLTTENYPFRPLAVGDLLVGGNDEIALGGNGRVTFVQWDGTATLPCPKYYLTMGASLNFGSSVAVGDFDGKGHMDLAVGAPPDKVYVYFGPLDSLSIPLDPQTPPSLTITNRLPNTRFGQRIAAYHVPGAPAARLMVADPAAPEGSFTGKVMLFDVAALLGSTTAPTDAHALATLFDSREDAGLGFGMNLGALAFNPQLCLPGVPVQLVPWATNHRDVLSFFNYASIPPTSDPRCFALRP